MNKKGRTVVTKGSKTSLVGRNAKTGRLTSVEYARMPPRSHVVERMSMAGVTDAGPGARAKLFAAVRSSKSELKIRPTAAALSAMAERIEELEARLAYIRTRREESFPAEVARRLVKGDNPIRVFREHRGLTQRQLAEAVGIGKPYLSEIEAGKKPGSVGVLAKIADTLNVQIDDLV